jgi:RNA recognition motif-containing protein
MFVGGLSLDTEEEDLKEHFAQYGTVMHCVVKRDPMNGRSRCFGFVTFTNSAAIKKVIRKFI